MLEQRLSQLAVDGRHPILVVDDAQILTPDHFQILHLLLNVTREAKAHFSLILVGEPDLLPKIQRIGALDDRIEVRTTLRPFTPEETRAYVLDRLFAAGRSTDVFSPDAFEALWETSQGIPRKINQLCELALLVGYADSLSSVTGVEIEAAADELTSVAVD
jgi:general secretion pathway protein A